MSVKETVARLVAGEMTVQDAADLIAHELLVRKDLHEMTDDELADRYQKAADMYIDDNEFTHVYFAKDAGHLNDHEVAVIVAAISGEQRIT